MVYFQKTQPAPHCLAIEKAKPTGKYRCGDVATRLSTDFKHKCYLCEFLQSPSVNIEHFVAHNGNTDLKFEWENLFWACVHCNNTKQAVAKSRAILNCTKMEDRVDEVIHYRINVFPGELVELRALHESEKAQNTADLLRVIYNGHKTEIKKIEALSLRSHLQKEIITFNGLIQRFAELTKENSNELQKIRRRIHQHLSNESAFTAFKRWIIRDDKGLMAEFGSFFS